MIGEDLLVKSLGDMRHRKQLTLMVDEFSLDGHLFPQ
jgi:hypothetical protein